MRLLSLLFLTILCTCVRAQNGEFTIHSNGFIYPEATMTDLGMIVDSLDLAFRQCDLNREYLAPAQTMARCYILKGRNAKKVAKRLREISLKEGFAVPKSFAQAKLIRYGVLYASPGTARSPGDQFNLLPLNYGANLSFKVKGKYTFRINDQLYVSGNEEKTYVWELNKKPYHSPIPEAHARLIQYVDCMVDTSQGIYRASTSNATGGYLDDGKSDRAAAHLFRLVESKYPARKPLNIWKKKKEPSDQEVQEWYRAMQEYEAGQLTWIQEQIASDDKLQIAVKDLGSLIEKGQTVGERAETVLERCGYAKLALESKRLRRVYGSCSQDSSPRIHAMEIARLSAASVEWSVFLRAHLNIMNDRFDRASDGSYAYDRRGTYLGELEALGIDAVGLLIGSCLEAEGLSPWHYESSWAKVGRALRDANDTDAVVKRLQAIIRDETLDDLNRMTGVYLLRFMAKNYGHEGTDERYVQALKAAIEGLKAEWVPHLEFE